MNIKILILIGILSLSSCTPTRYQLAPHTTQLDFQHDLQSCGGSVEPEPGYCLFGPAIVVLPAMAIIEGVKAVQRQNVKQCMEVKGYKALDN